MKSLVSYINVTAGLITRMSTAENRSAGQQRRYSQNTAMRIETKLNPKKPKRLSTSNDQLKLLGSYTQLHKETNVHRRVVIFLEGNTAQNEKKKKST
jgi:hypothetical protein